MKRKRYDVYAFGLNVYDSPCWSTNYWCVAVLYRMLRSYFGLRICEIRIIDNATGEHYVYL